MRNCRAASPPSRRPPRSRCNGVPVNAASARFPDGSAGVVLGAQVEVDGHMLGGVLVAHEVEIEIDAMPASAPTSSCTAPSVRWTAAARPSCCAACVSAMPATRSTKTAAPPSWPMAAGSRSRASCRPTGTVLHGSARSTSRARAARLLFQCSPVPPADARPRHRRRAAGAAATRCAPCSRRWRSWRWRRACPTPRWKSALKQAVVQAAAAAHPQVAPHRSVSRISTATGINRREVTRLLQAQADAPTPAALAGERAVRPLAQRPGLSGCAGRAARAAARWARRRASRRWRRR